LNFEAYEMLNVAVFDLSPAEFTGNLLRRVLHCPAFMLILTDSTKR